MTAPRDDDRRTNQKRGDDDLDAAPTRLNRRGRARYATGSGDHRLARPLVIALVGVVAVAAAIFWPRGGGQHVVAVDPVHVVRIDTTMVAPSARSGEVDLGQARQPLVAEQPSRERTTQRDVPLDLKARVQPEPATGPAAPPSAAPNATEPATAEPPTTPTPAETAIATPPKPVPAPQPNGPFALQVASFASEEGAQASRDDLAARGFPVHVRAASTATGAIVYRVWVGYFATRDDAAAYAAAHGEALPGATPVHR